MYQSIEVAFQPRNLFYVVPLPHYSDLGNRTKLEISVALLLICWDVFNPNLTVFELLDVQSNIEYYQYSLIFDTLRSQISQKKQKNGGNVE
jgi:hypothetical protein